MTNLFAGIDIGSLSAECVITDLAGHVVAKEMSFTGASSKTAAQRVFETACQKAKMSPSAIKCVVATGYGRISVPFSSKRVTEITCHAIGTHHLLPRSRTVIDIGGQDSKVMRLDDKGRVVDFAMNDKCAAGTGRFLEVMAKALEVKLEDLGSLGHQAENQIVITSMCTVFAESEVISLIAEETPKQDIAAGLFRSVASRVASMAKRLGIEPDVVMTGGVAKNLGVVIALEQALGHPVLVPPDPQFTGALGAALIARQQGG